MMDDALRMRLESLTRRLSEAWPVDTNGVCRFCGFSTMIPGPRSEPYEAVERLLSHFGHQPSCCWVSAREIIKLLG